MGDIRQMHRASKSMGDYRHSEFQQPDAIFDDAVEGIPNSMSKDNLFYQKPLSMRQAKRANTKFQRAWRDTPRKEARENSRREAEEAKLRARQYLEEYQQGGQTPPLKMNREAIEPDWFKYGEKPTWSKNRMHGYQFGALALAPNSTVGRVKGMGAIKKFPIGKKGWSIDPSLTMTNVSGPGFNIFQGSPGVGFTKKFQKGGQLPYDTTLDRGPRRKSYYSKPGRATKKPNHENPFADVSAFSHIERPMDYKERGHGPSSGLSKWNQNSVGVSASIPLFYPHGGPGARKRDAPYTYFGLYPSIEKYQGTYTDKSKVPASTRIDPRGIQALPYRYKKGDFPDAEGKFSGVKGKLGIGTTWNGPSSESRLQLFGGLEKSDIDNKANPSIGYDIYHRRKYGPYWRESSFGPTSRAEMSRDGMSMAHGLGIKQNLGKGRSINADIDIYGARFGDSGQATFFPSGNIGYTHKFQQGGQFKNNNMNTYRTGGITPQKAKEMLRDGTANGRPLTAAQKKYFGLIASGKLPKYQKAGTYFDEDFVPDINPQGGRYTVPASSTANPALGAGIQAQRQMFNRPVQYDNTPQSTIGYPSTQVGMGNEPNQQFMYPALRGRDAGVQQGMTNRIIASG